MNLLRGLDPRIDAAMADAIIARRYSPTTYRGSPANVKLTVTISFPPIGDVEESGSNEGVAVPPPEDPPSGD